MNYRNTLLTTLLLVAAPLAMAQYMWIDDKGIKQFSDRPPPPNIPEKRILKAPGKPLFNPNATEPEPAAETQAAKAAPTLAERNADFNKRRSEAADVAKQTAANAQRKADEAANCNAARQHQQALDQGLRLSSYDKNGERGYMNDDQREELRKNTQKVLADCK
ncbi:DUF4124 domain-containing protein [Duganella sp. FT135W]|uniref:DUF4124 domain-containing protein n=1 Tax=Duganella flavida TaxID=2692175 RepID=A0A6L8KDT2_9BURK|nr:DUF4124 domain-containing protein [Duganella flavida]MYM22591.1 DUF4124 domain-containing protein [Duganella flavida]